MAETVVITGANRGIGLELAKVYAGQGATVVGVCRTASPELKEAAAEVVEGVDVATGDGTAKLARALSGRTVDVLINNAGIMRRETLDDLNFHTMTEQFEVNALGPLRVVEALLDRMGEGGKVAVVTSRMGSIADNTSGSRYGYRMSKAALNIAAVSLAHDLKPRGIAVTIVHPGFVQTDMTGGNGEIEPAIAAARIADRIAETTLETSGTFWHSKGEVLPW